MSKEITTLHYFVDESGDGVLFNKKGRCLSGTGNVREHFMLGLLLVDDTAKLESDLISLRKDLLNDPFFKDVPSMQPVEKKTAKLFHAKDDLPEVRREVYKLLVKHDLKFFAVIKSMVAVYQYVQSRNMTDPSYRYHPDELYDLTVRRLFKNRLHQKNIINVTFARRGKKARTKHLAYQLGIAAERFREKRNTVISSQIKLQSEYSWESAGLQAVDYFLWALSRLYSRKEDRFIQYIWERVSLIVDMDDIRENSYGRYYTKEKPLSAATIP